MPSIRYLKAVIDKLHVEAKQEVEDGDGHFHETMAEMAVAINMLSEAALQTVTRYDYWRRQYCLKAGMSESDFDAMTDECISHESEPETPCQHLVVNSLNRCANCGKRV